MQTVSTKKLTISIVIPLYNESRRVHIAINALNQYLLTFGYDHEVIFVDDGSTDDTVNQIAKLNPQFKFQVISYQPNHGKGYAVKQGVLAATGDYILMCDVDMSTPIDHLDKFIKTALTGHDVVIGSRKQGGANVIKHQPFLREKLGQGFTLLSNILIAPGISDFTCGFKLFSQKAGKHIFEKQRIERWGFDTEVIFLARKYDFKIAELPVCWINDTETKVDLTVDVTTSLLELFNIRINNLNRRY